MYDKAQVGHLDGPQCKNQKDNMMLGFVMAAPVGTRLNLDDKS